MPEKTPTNDNSDQAKPLSRQMLDDIKTQLQHSPKSSGFAGFPESVRFETQEEQEKIILLLKPHFITNYRWIFATLVLAVIPLFFLYVPFFDFLPTRFQLMTLILWYLLVFAYALQNYLSWYFDAYLITDERVVDVDFYSLLYKQISETKLDKIEDVTYSQGGLLQSMFNYGDVIIQTAAEIPRIEFEYVPQPQLVVKVLNQLITQEQQEVIEGRVR